MAKVRLHHRFSVLVGDEGHRKATGAIFEVTHDLDAPPMWPALEGCQNRILCGAPQDQAELAAVLQCYGRLRTALSLPTTSNAPCQRSYRALQWFRRRTKRRHSRW
jgi:hypothetical protein